MKKPFFCRTRRAGTILRTPALLAVALGVLMVVAGVQEAKGDWVAGRDMAAMEKPDGSSPNDGTNNKVPQWSYGYRTTTTGQAFTRFSPTEHIDNNFGSLDGWDRNDLKVQVNTSTSAVTLQYCCGPLKPLAAAEILLHPGRDLGRPVVRWTTPAAGTYIVGARWEDLDNHGGNGASGHLVLNGVEIFGQGWSNDGSATMPTQSVTVRQGDVLDFVLDAEGDFNFDSTGFDATIIAAPTFPAHGGLSTTTFTVNGSSSPAYPPASAPVNGLVDTVLRFAAQQNSGAAGLFVRVQATTTPNVESSWTNLSNCTKGQMTQDGTSSQFLLNSNDYPTQQADPVYFRAVASAEGYADSISNVVGPFNLTSSEPRMGTTRLVFAANGPLADFYWKATESATPQGITVRVQMSTTPGVESSWTNVPIGNSGTMTRSTNKNFPNDFILLGDQLPDSRNTYFRAIAAAPGYVDSLSNIVGPFKIVDDKPPVVAVFPPEGRAGSGSGGSIGSPIIISEGKTNFAAVAHSDRTIAKVQLKVDGQIVAEYPGNSDQNAIYYGPFDARVGHHILEAVAFDDLGAHGRAGTNPVHVDVIPAVSAAKARNAAEAANSATAVTGRVFKAVKDGAWTDPATWDQNDVPDGHDFVIISSHTVSFVHSAAEGNVIFVRSLTIDNATLTAVHGTALNVSLKATIGDCIVNGGLGIIVKTAATDPALQPTCELVNTRDIRFVPDQLSNRGFIFNTGGTFLVHGSAGLIGADQIINHGKIQWVQPLQIAPNAAFDPAAGTRVLQASSIPDQGIISGDNAYLIGEDGSSLINQDGAGLIDQDGAGLINQDGASIVSNDGGSLINQDGAGTIAQGGGNLLSQDGAGVIAQGGGNVIAAGGGNVIAAGGGNFYAALAARETTAPTGYIKSGGDLNLTSTFVFGSLTLDGGVLSGNGIIRGNLTNNGGYIAPGGLSAPGLIAVTGNFSQGTNGTTIVERSGPYASQFDRLQIGGAAALGGKLDVKTINGYKPAATDSFNPLGYKSVSGSFGSISSDAHVTFGATGAVATVNPAAPQPRAGQPLNISTRMNVLTGDNALIAGFIVTGPTGSTKKVLVRGLGPSLAKFGVPGTLSDPLLELHKPGGAVVSNDNWQQGDTSQIPSGFAPSDPHESLIVATLAPGNYSAVLKGAHNETGVGIAELYDLDSASTAQLANISTRGFVNTGDNVMIGGFIVGGGEPTKVLVRAIGPSLTAFGVKGALPATTLELHDANGAVISNEGWRSTQEAEIKATTIPPSNDNEAAILATLVPGNYTAVVRGKDNTTGIGLVEAYNLQ